MSSALAILAFDVQANADRISAAFASHDLLEQGKHAATPVVLADVHALNPINRRAVAPS